MGHGEKEPTLHRKSDILGLAPRKRERDCPGRKGETGKNTNKAIPAILEDRNVFRPV